MVKDITFSDFRFMLNSRVNGCNVCCGDVLCSDIQLPGLFGEIQFLILIMNALMQCWWNFKDSPAMGGLEIISWDDACFTYFFKIPSIKW